MRSSTGPRLEPVAAAFAALLGLELVINRVLTRTSIFLPQAAAGPLTVVAVVGSLLMMAVAVVALVILLGLVLWWGRTSLLRGLSGALLVAFAASMVMPSLVIGPVVMVLALAVILVAASRSTFEGPLGRAARGLLVASVAAFTYFNLANAGLMGSLDLTVAPELYMSSEALFLLAILAVGVRGFQGHLGIGPPATAAAVTALLLVLYLRNASLFAAVAYWSLGFGLFLPPLFFAAVFVGLVALMTRSGPEASAVALLLFSGIDLRISYIAAAVVLATLLLSRREARAAVERTSLEIPAVASEE